MEGFHSQSSNNIELTLKGLVIKMAENQDIAETSGAKLWLAKNELVLDGKAAFDDPVKFRGSSTHPGGYLVCVSGDLIDGPRYEKGFFAIRHDDDYPKDVKAYEFVVFLQDPNGIEDSTMRPHLRVTHQYIEVHNQRVSFGGGGGLPDTIWSPDGVWFTQQQADGNLVKYKTAVPFDKSQAITAKLIG